MKRNVVLFACFLIVFGICSCQRKGSEAAAEVQKVTLSWWQDDSTPDRQELMMNGAAKYMASNPNVTIEVGAFPNKMDDKLQIAFAAGEGPDVFVANFGLVKAFILNKNIIPLDDYFTNSPVKDSLFPPAVDATRSLDAEEGKLYGLPSSNNVFCMWVRPDWFKAAGIALPVTWDDTFEAIEKLTDKPNGRYGVGLRGGAGGGENIEYLMYSYSGILDYFTPDGKCTINDPLHVEFAEKWFGQYNVYTAEGDIGNGWTELAAGFTSGHSAIIQHNLGSATGHNTAFEGDLSKFQAIPFPLSVKGTNVHPSLTPGLFVLSSTCENKDEGFKFLTFLSSGDYVGDYCRITGAMPMDVNVMQEDWIKNTPWMNMGAQLLLSDTTQFYQTASFLPSYYSSRTNEVDPMIQAVMAGQMTAKEMLDRWAAMMEEMLRVEG